MRNFEVREAIEKFRCVSESNNARMRVPATPQHPGRTDHEGDGWPLADPVKLSVEKVLVNLRLFPEQ